MNLNNILANMHYTLVNYISNNEVSYFAEDIVNESRIHLEKLKELDEQLNLALIDEGDDLIVTVYVLDKEDGTDTTIKTLRIKLLQDSFSVKEEFGFVDCSSISKKGVVNND